MHLKDFQSTTNPNHVQAQLPQTRQGCHNTASWAGATFNHASTGFTLTGAHTTLQCSQCHVNGNYTLNTGACSSCHLKDYQGTTNPSHAQGGFPTTCDSCHTTISWAGATFNHNSTGFPLTGAHTTVNRRRHDLFTSLDSWFSYTSSRLVETRASKSSIVKSVKGFFRKDARVIYQNVDGSEVVDRCFDRFSSSLLLADIAIHENQGARGGQLSTGVTRRRDDVITFSQKLFN